MWRRWLRRVVRLLLRGGERRRRLPERGVNIGGLRFACCDGGRVASWEGRGFGRRALIWRVFSSYSAGHSGAIGGGSNPRAVGKTPVSMLIDATLRAHARCESLVWILTIRWLLLSVGIGGWASGGCCQRGGGRGRRDYVVDGDSRWWCVHGVAVA